VGVDLWEAAAAAAVAAGSIGLTIRRTPLALWEGRETEGNGGGGGQQLCVSAACQERFKVSHN